MINLISRICSFQKERIENFFSKKQFDFKSIVGFELSGSRSVKKCEWIFQIVESFLKACRRYMVDTNKMVLEKNLTLNVFKNLNGYYFFRDLHEGNEGEWYTNISMSEHVKKMIEIIRPRDVKKVIKTTSFALAGSVIFFILFWIAWHMVLEPEYKFTVASIPLWYSAFPVVITIICLIVSSRRLIIHLKNRKRLKLKLLKNPSWLFHGKVSSGDEDSEKIRIIFEYSFMGDVERDTLKYEYEKMLETAFKIAQSNNWKIGILWNWKRKRNYFQSTQDFIVESRDLIIKIGSYDEALIFVENKDGFIFIKPPKCSEGDVMQSDLLIINRIFGKDKENIFLPNYSG